MIGEVNFIGPKSKTITGPVFKVVIIRYVLFGRLRKRRHSDQGEERPSPH